MCDPYTEAAMFAAGQLEADQGAKAHNKAAKVNRQNAVNAYGSQKNAAINDMMQSGVIFRTEATDTVLEGARQQGAASAKLADNGSSGGSEAMILDSFSLARDTLLGRQKANYQNEIKQGFEAQDNAKFQLRQRLANNRNKGRSIFSDTGSLLGGLIGEL